MHKLGQKVTLDTKYKRNILQGKDINHVFTITGKSPIKEGLRWKKGDWYYHLDNTSGYYHPDDLIVVSENQ